MECFNYTGRVKQDLPYPLPSPSKSELVTFIHFALAGRMRRASLRIQSTIDE
jgi:hypothetical protein